MNKTMANIQTKQAAACAEMLIGCCNLNPNPSKRSRMAGKS
jgi:hypothetical protein